jgi:predicted lipid-binding transport protein (Tim44 family)
MAVILNLAAVVVIGFFVWSSMTPPASGEDATATASNAKPAATAKPIATADKPAAKSAKPAAPAPATTPTAGNSQ